MSAPLGQFEGTVALTQTSTAGPRLWPRASLSAPLVEGTPAYEAHSGPDSNVRVQCLSEQSGPATRVSPSEDASQSMPRQPSENVASTPSSLLPCFITPRISKRNSIRGPTLLRA